MRRALVLFAAAVATGCGGTVEREAAPPKPIVSKALPALPAEGLAAQSAPEAIVFFDLHGRRVGVIRGYRLEPKPGFPLAVVRGKRVYRLDLSRRRVVPLSRAAVLGAARRATHVPCDPGRAWRNVRYFVCLREGRRLPNPSVERVDSRGRRSIVVANPPATRTAGDAGKVGSWREAIPSPDGRTLLLQWSGECEVPIAFFADAAGGGLRVVSGERDWARAPESSALGFATDGRALVSFPKGLCGGSVHRPGVYEIDPVTLQRRFLLRPPRSGLMVMWGPYAASAP